MIDALGGVINDDGIGLLAERLSSLAPEDVESFCAHLAAKVGALADLPLEGLAVPDVTDVGRDALPLAGDAHENFLYAIVAAGRARYEAADRRPRTRPEAQPIRRVADVVEADVTAQDQDRYNSQFPREPAQDRARQEHRESSFRDGSLLSCRSRPRRAEKPGRRRGRSPDKGHRRSTAHDVSSRSSASLRAGNAP
ncbi:hypothetical protein [Nonomuraea sp. SYSU D8015]|uniref:hypothetical protein n=1 Tax=Nonomuraea sp. SYSU D8015 TaxID=2593644 RepID=UPI003FA60ECB